MESGSSATGTDPTDEVQEHAEQPVAEQNPVDQKELCSRTIQTTYDLVVSIFNMTILYNCLVVIVIKKIRTYLFVLEYKFFVPCIYRKKNGYWINTYVSRTPHPISKTM